MEVTINMGIQTRSSARQIHLEDVIFDIPTREHLKTPGRNDSRRLGKVTVRHRNHIRRIDSKPGSLTIRALVCLRCLPRATIGFSSSSSPDNSTMLVIMGQTTER
jgi:hypothetical protein